MAAAFPDAMSTLLFHNPSAGTADRAPAGLVAALRAAGLLPCYCNTKSERFAAMLQRPAGLVVVSGGDGTVGKVFTHRRDRTAPSLILPHGTANNVARSLGIFGEPRDFAAALAAWRPRPLRLGVADGPWGRRRFVEAAGVGAIPQMLADTAATRGDDGGQPTRVDKLARGRRMLAALLKTAAPVPLRFWVDGAALEADVLMLEVLNTRQSGPRLVLGPRTGEGMLHVTIVRAADRKPMRAWLKALDTGAAEPPAPPPVWHLRGRNIVLRWAGMPLRLDDEWMPAPATAAWVRIGIDPVPLAVLAPPGRPERWSQ